MQPIECPHLCLEGSHGLHSMRGASPVRSEQSTHGECLGSSKEASELQNTSQENMKKNLRARAYRNQDKQKMTSRRDKERTRRRFSVAKIYRSVRRRRKKRVDVKLRLERKDKWVHLDNVVRVMITSWKMYQIMYLQRVLLNSWIRYLTDILRVKIESK